MSEEPTRRRPVKGLKATARKISDGAPDMRQIQSFIDEYPLLSLAFVVAAGYALGRVISKL
jgi:hypothetical protein